MIKFKEYFKPVQEQEELKEEVLEEAVYWHVRIPGISSPIFVEAPSKSGIKQDLRTQLKPEAWKDLSIDRITKPQIRKIYRDMAKDPDGPEETDEDLSTAEILKKKKIKISHPGYGTEEGVDEGIMDTAGFHNYPKRNKVGDEIEKIASKGGTDKFNLSKVASELQKGRIPHKFIKKLSPKSKKAVHDIMKDFGWKVLPEEVNESTAEYAKSLEKNANDRALKMLSKSERTNLKKIAALLNKEKKEEVDSTSEGIFGSTTAKKTRDKLFLARSRENTVKKEKPNNVQEIVPAILGLGAGMAARSLTKKAVGGIGSAVAGGVASGVTRAATKHALNKRKEKKQEKEEKEPRIRIEAKKLFANMKKFKEEVFQHHIVQGNTESGKVAHTGTLKQMQKKIRDPKMGSDHVLVKTRHDLKTGDNWKKHMHAENLD